VDQHVQHARKPGVVSHQKTSGSIRRKVSFVT
jgi:hypothetical protein